MKLRHFQILIECPQKRTERCKVERNALSTIEFESAEADREV